MRRARTLAACLGVLLLLTLTVSSAKADGFCADELIVKLNNIEGHQLNLPEQSRAGTALLFAELFENNNGKHLGFSVASTNRGNKFGLFRGPNTSNSNKDKEKSGGSSSNTIPNPEPAAVFLLATGLAAAGAFARKRFRKSSH